MADDINVYNLDEQSTSTDIYDLSTSDTGTTVDDASESNLTEQDVRDLILDTLQSYDGELRLGAELSNQALIIDSQGIRLGGTDFATAQFSVNMDGVMTAQAGTFSGTVDVGELNIPDADTTANSFHTDTTGNSWWGATTTSFTADNDNAPAYVLKDGSAKFQDILIGDSTAGKFLSYNTTDDELIVEGQTAFANTLTANWDITQGEVVAIESDGFIYPTRASDFEGTTASNTATAGSGRTNANTALVNFTDAVSIQLIQESTTLYYQRVVTDVDVPEVTSISTSTYTTTGTTEPDLDKLSDTTAIVTSNNSTTVYAQVFSGLDTGVTANTEISVDTDAVTPRVRAYSSTRALCVYKENSTGDIKVRPLSISGTTVTAGSESNVHTASGTATIQSFARFGTSNYYCLSVHDGSTPWFFPIEYDGTTVTVGSGISGLGSLYSATAASRQPTICSIDDTRVAVSLLDNQSAKVVIISQSSGTLTINTPLTFDTVASAAANDGSYCIGLGADTFAVSYISDSNTDLDAQLFRVTDNTITTLGTQQGIGTVSSSAPMNTSRDIPIVKVAPEWVMFSWESGTNTDNFALYKLDTNFETAIGVATENIDDGNTGRVVLAGYSDDFSGLTAADPLYLDLDGDVTNSAGGGRQKLGVALSSSEVKISL